MRRYVDAFGNTKSVQRRQDMQLQKFFAPFSGWFLDPRFRYYLYVWSSNASQGDPAQVVGAGNLSWTWNRFVTAGFGITSLPSTRSTEGQFPYWLGVDNRLIADEFFRGFVHDGRLAEGRDRVQPQVPRDARQQPEHAGRQRRATRQPVQHPVLRAPVAADNGRVRALRGPSATTTITRRSPPGSAGTTPIASKKSRLSLEPRGSRTAKSGSPTAASSSLPICSAPASR